MGALSHRSRVAGGLAPGSCTHAVARPRASLPVASDLLFQAQRLVSQVVLLFRQTADEAGELSILPEQPLRQGAGGASCLQGDALRPGKPRSAPRLAATFAQLPINRKRLEPLTSGTEGRGGDCCSVVMTSSTLACTQDKSSRSTSAVELQRVINETPGRWIWERRGRSGLW